MLRIIKGTDRSGKTQMLAAMVKQSIESGRKTCIMIPDQFSLVYDRKLYGILGAKAFNSVTIIGPNRLARRLIDKYGSSGKYCDDNARLIMMYKACREFETEGGAKYFTRSLRNGSFFGEVCDTIDELRQGEADARSLEAASEQLHGTVSAKLYDISQLYSLYLMQLEKHGLKDTNSAMAEAVEIIRRQQLFKDCDVYFDSFSSFTGDQTKLLKAIFSQAHAVTAALTIGNGRNAAAVLTPFRECIDTASQLEDMAATAGHEIKRFRADSYEYSSDALRVLSDNVFAPPQKTNCKGDGIKIVSVSDAYSEAEFVFAQIRNLVDSGEYKYGDIAIISRSLEECSGILEDMAECYEVPLFCDLRKNVSQTSPVLFVSAVFENMVSRSFRTRPILAYIKSPLSKISISDAALIEEYCFKWSVDGDMWLSDFTASSKATKQARADELNKINDIRKRIIEPLSELKRRCTDASADEISVALLSFMQDVDMDARTFVSLKEMSAAESETSLEISRVFRQLWQLFISAITSIHDILKSEKTSIREYYELLRTMLSQMTVSSPPQKLDAVIAASAQHSRLSGIKAAFVIGVNDGLFPKNIHMQGLFSDREKEQLLRNAGIKMEKRLETSIQSERFSCFQALSCASDRLYLCVPSCDRKGKLLDPSPLVSQINALFSGDITLDASKLGIEFFCSSKQAALHKYAELVRRDRNQARAIKEALKAFPEYYERTEFIDLLLEDKEHSLSNKTAKELFFSKDMQLSATQVKKFYSCPFQYFCHYGLGIHKNQKVELGITDIGSIIHYCLEKNMMALGDKFKDMTDRDIEVSVDASVDEYIAESMGGDFGKEASFATEVAELKKRVTRTVAHVRDEFCNTDFKAVAFEYKLIDKDGTPLMTIAPPEGTDIDVKIVMTGSIDRVDTLKTNGKTYVRIIDYKSGKESFRYDNVYHGLNLQMLIYMFAILSASSSNKGKMLQPAAIVYMHTHDISDFDSKESLKSKLEKSTPAQIIEELIKKCFSRDGVAVDNMEIIQNMSKNNDGSFTPIPITGKGVYNKTYAKYALSEKEFANLESFALNKISEMIDSLYHGNIPSIPTVRGRKTPCEYCDFREICSNANGDRASQITKEDEQKLLECIADKTSTEEAGDSNAE